MYEWERELSVRMLDSFVFLDCGDREEEDGYEFSDEDIDDEALMEEDEFGNFEDTDDVFAVRSSGGYKHPCNVVHRGCDICLVYTPRFLLA
jgi:hypothetical protein